MEVNGRKCEVLKIGEDKLYLPKKWKGKEVMATQKLMYGDTTVSADGKNINVGQLLINMPQLFPILCLKIEGKDKEVPVTVEYLEELDADDFLKVQKKISQAINQMNANEEKKD
jgi:hypothetical protein